MSVCQNPACNKEYAASDIDDGFCTYSCWEAVNCHEPHVEIFETIHIPSIVMESV